MIDCFGYSLVLKPGFVYLYSTKVFIQSNKKKKAAVNSFQKKY
jgi:hypothetical protein